ncbi:uncharacterized protein JN550_013369 [Neoarthrinium moseri]|uniref:uncharacterized protein n=1 Tax=Neoarthrinium moseri TaxID=1658444 RepID=UPI001FDCC1F5|nr:uncharacterized protein JN550_013369 [Neoarthrinium moseri]KAI1857234.1 hypothetical protein JN550_013369 [Neoarthrinium moseri]
MSLHRKPGFHRGCDLVVARAYPLVTINGYPESDYEKVQQTGTGWIGVPWRDRGRLVQVEHASHVTITDFESLVNLRHLHVAPFLGLYYNRTSTDIVYERLDLDLLDICPLASEAEVASVLAQMLSAITHLLSSPVDVRIASVRISMFGLVKLSTHFRLTVSMFFVVSATRHHPQERDAPLHGVIHRASGQGGMSSFPSLLVTLQH